MGSKNIHEADGDDVSREDQLEVDVWEASERLASGYLRNDQAIIDEATDVINHAQRELYGTADIDIEETLGPH